MTETTENLELLKAKDPARYKAISIAGLGYFNNESLVPIFIEDLTSYINEIAGTVIDGKVTLKYPIPSEAINIDDLTKALVEDIKENEIDCDLITLRLKSLVTRTLEALKTASADYSAEGDIVSVEKCHGYYDQLMILKETARIADATH